MSDTETESLMPESQDWAPICQAITENPVFWQIVAAIAILVVALVILTRIRRWRKGVLLTDSDNGSIRVSSAALHDLVTSACSQIDIVRKPKVRFRTEGGRLHLHAKVRLAAGRRITDVYEEMKRELTSTLEQTLGYERIGTIDVTVTGFEKSKRKTTSLYSNTESKRSADDTADDDQNPFADDDSRFESPDQDGSEDKRDDTVR
jgi:uncharacterized alkaline shock family protein YloU